jgi:hypothetical protein
VLAATADLAMVRFHGYSPNWDSHNIYERFGALPHPVHPDRDKRAAGANLGSHQSPTSGHAEPVQVFDLAH